MRWLIWVQCLTATVGVAVACGDATGRHPPPVSWLLGSALGVVVCMGAFWVGVTVPALILFEVVRQRPPARRWVPVFGLSLPLAAVQLTAFAQLVR